MNKEHHKTMPSHIVIATRESKLALWQAEFVRQKLVNAYPDCQFSLLGMTTQGDQILDKPLAKIGGKGLFIKELENALLTGRADIAVHSMKDVPIELESAFCLASIWQRADPRDAFVTNRFASLEDMPPGAVVGTSSLRRAAQLRAQFPYLAVSDLRGNLETRLRKLDEGQYDAIILAAAGLLRLGYQDRICNYLSIETSIPAVGQGALGIECLQDRPEIISLLQTTTDPLSWQCVMAERAFSHRLGGSCEVPLGAYACVSHEQLFLKGFVADVEGRTILRAECKGDAKHYAQLGKQLAEQLIAQGAVELLQDGIMR